MTPPNICLFSPCWVGGSESPPFYAGVYGKLAGGLLALGHVLGRWQTGCEELMKGGKPLGVQLSDLGLVHAGRLADLVSFLFEGFVAVFTNAF